MTLNSQAKGKRAERDLANWFKVNGYPRASRAVKTGTRFEPDAGDLILEHLEFRMVVEVKDHASPLTEGEIDKFGRKLVIQTIQFVPVADIGILVEKRTRVADPGRWWVHMPGYVYAVLAELGQTPSRFAWLRPIRTTVDDFVDRLRQAGLAGPLAAVADSATSTPDGLATGAETAELHQMNTNGGA